MVRQSLPRGVAAASSRSLRLVGLVVVVVLVACVVNIQNGNHAMRYLQQLTQPLQQQVQPETSANTTPNEIIPESVPSSYPDTPTTTATTTITTTSSSSQEDLQLVQPNDFIYKYNPRQWDAAPIVIEEYKLVFFAIGKVASTTWKHAFRKMMKLDNWLSLDPYLQLPHNPATNGLVYLYNYTLDEANERMTSPHWTRAIFVRDPKIRFISAFLDLVQRDNATYLRQRHCCGGCGNGPPPEEEDDKACLEGEGYYDSSPQVQQPGGFLDFIQRNCTIDRHWTPYSDRMEAKYWPYINFVGHFETIQDDSKTLLQRIGAWEAHGKMGWGLNQKWRIFGKDQTRQAQKRMMPHVVQAEQQPRTLDLGLEVRVDAFYQRDYDNPLFHLTKTPLFKGREHRHIRSFKRQTATFGNNSNSGLVLDPRDSIYYSGGWDVAPIVIPKYKLVFFTVPKVACTTWKQAFRRMMGYSDWDRETGPHNPRWNGLRYLYHFPIETANEIMTSPSWTRAIFVRDPKIRMLSAFMDKALSDSGKHVINKCCWVTRDCLTAAQTMNGFLDLAKWCTDPHWQPQSLRMDAKYWPYINFVGHFETLAEDARRLLEHIGAWEEMGQTGWGNNGQSTIFEKPPHNQNHVTHSNSKVLQWYTLALERRVEEFYEGDYNLALLNYAKTNLTTWEETA